MTVRFKTYPAPRPATPSDPGFYEQFAAQLDSNADAHREPAGTERRRAAAAIRDLLAETRRLREELAAANTVIRNAQEATRRGNLATPSLVIDVLNSDPNTVLRERDAATIRALAATANADEDFTVDVALGGASYVLQWLEERAVNTENTNETGDPR